VVVGGFRRIVSKKKKKGRKRRGRGRLPKVRGAFDGCMRKEKSEKALFASGGGGEKRETMPAIFQKKE